MKERSNEIKPDLVLGIAQGYSFDQLKPFVVSLKQTGYRGETAFFCHRIGSSTRQSLRQWGIQVVPFHNYRSPRDPKAVRASVDKLACFYYRLKWPFYRKGWHLLLAAAKQRYYLYHRFLLRFQDRYHRVLLADVRDIFFQRNPFEGCLDHDLLFFEEDHRQLLRTGVYNLSWMISLLGKPTFDRLKNKVTLCSGTIMGKPVALIHYLEKYLALLQAAQRIDSIHGDQAIHNAIVYEHLAGIPFSTSIVPNDHGPVYTLGSVIPAAEIRVSTGNEVLFPDGRVAPVLHQYDRFPKLASILHEKISRAILPRI